MKLKPKTEALAYRIWAYCEPKEWNCTVNEIADVLGVSPHTIGAICTHKKWHQRLRSPHGLNADHFGRFARHAPGGLFMHDFDNWGAQ